MQILQTFCTILRIWGGILVCLCRVLCQVNPLAEQPLAHPLVEAAGHDWKHMLGLGAVHEPSLVVPQSLRQASANIAEHADHLQHGHALLFGPRPIARHGVSLKLEGFTTFRREDLPCKCKLKLGVLTAVWTDISACTQQLWVSDVKHAIQKMDCRAVSELQGPTLLVKQLAQASCLRRIITTTAANDRCRFRTTTCLTAA
mmetsp:Transcript_38941/g.110140  ORF Transcript_38941/g.110140 Transcript_38941/m.110140 type:complete len:201 (-) Transcript_38941:343-945(-)